VSSLEIEIFVLFSKDKNFNGLKDSSLLVNFSEKFGKLSEGKHSRLKFELSDFMLSLFSFFNSNFNSVLADTFLKMSYKIVAEVVVLPSVVI
jgi:hypothetical protein